MRIFEEYLVNILFIYCYYCMRFRTPSWKKVGIASILEMLFTRTLAHVHFINIMYICDQKEY